MKVLVNGIFFYCISLTVYIQKSWARPGFEPGTSRTLSGNHTPRPTSLDVEAFKGRIISKYEYFSELFDNLFSI